MNGNTIRKVVCCATFLLLVLSAAAQADAQQQTFQKLPVKLKASKMLPPALLHVSTSWVDEIVYNDGFVNTYQLHTVYGTFPVEGTDLLRERMHDLRVVEHMEKVRKSKAYKDAFAAAMAGPFKPLAGSGRPATAAGKATASRVGNWFSDVGRAIVSDDPYQENTSETARRYAAAKREFAYAYGVNPYSEFEPLRNNLQELAIAAAGGGFTVKAAFAAVPFSSAQAGQDTDTAIARAMKKLVRDNAPKALQKLNEDKLSGMGVPEELSDAFLNNYAYDPQERTLLVGALDSMKSTKERGRFIAGAVLAKSSDIARFMRLRAQMTAAYNAGIKPIKRFVEVDRGSIFALSGDGRVIALVPLDYVPSTPAFWRKEETLSKAIDGMQAVSGKELWITGSFAADVRAALESRGWRVTDNAWDRLLGHGSGR